VSWTGVTADGSTSVNASASESEVVGSRLRSVRFTGAELDRSRLVDVILEDCELSGVTVEEAVLVRVEFVRCRMSGLIGAGLKAQDVRFVDCKMDAANFRMATWERCEWVDTDAHEADFYAGTVAGCAFRRCDLRGVELSKADCARLVLNGSVLDGIRGADALRGCVIGSDQIVPLALALFGVLDIRVDDEVPYTDQ
jgi:uncharacterized protein YjbI with pentapeptide repeats